MRQALRSTGTASILAHLILTFTVSKADAGPLPLPAGPARLSITQPVRNGSSHLYVADSGAAMVYRFPLGSDGLPAQQPDLTLQGGLVSPVGLGFDRQGNLYVSDQDQHTVSVYAPGASGDAKPIRSLSLGNDTPQTLAVDPHGYLFVYDLNSGTINAYKPGANGNESPVQQIRNWGSTSSVPDIAIDKRGRMYSVIRGVPVSVEVYDDPVHATQPSELLLPDGQEALWVYSIALSQSQKELYIQYLGFSEGSWNWAAFADRHLGGPGEPQDRTIHTKDCPHFPSDPSEVFGLAVSGKYLIASCFGVGVFVYDSNHYGRQHAVEALNAPFVANWAVVLGP